MIVAAFGMLLLQPATVWAQGQATDASPSAPMFQACVGKSYAVKFKMVGENGEFEDLSDFYPDHVYPDRSYISRIHGPATDIHPESLRKIVQILKAGEDVTRTSGFQTANIRLVFLDYPNLAKRGTVSSASIALKFDEKWDRTLRSPWIQIVAKSKSECDLDILVTLNIRQTMFDQANLANGKVVSSGFAEPLDGTPFSDSKSSDFGRYIEDYRNILDGECHGDDTECNALIIDGRSKLKTKLAIAEQRQKISIPKLKKRIPPDVYWLLEPFNISMELLNFANYLSRMRRDLEERGKRSHPILVSGILQYFLQSHQSQIDIPDILELRRILPGAVSVIKLTFTPTDYSKQNP